MQIFKILYKLIHILLLISLVFVWTFLKDPPKDLSQPSELTFDDEPKSKPKTVQSSVELIFNHWKFVMNLIWLRSQKLLNKFASFDFTANKSAMTIKNSHLHSVWMSRLADGTEKFRNKWVDESIRQLSIKHTIQLLNFHRKQQLIQQI